VREVVTGTGCWLHESVKCPRHFALFSAHAFAVVCCGVVDKPTTQHNWLHNATSLRSRFAAAACLGRHQCLKHRVNIKLTPICPQQLRCNWRPQHVHCCSTCGTLDTMGQTQLWAAMHVSMRMDPSVRTASLRHFNPSAAWGQQQPGR
jgi:hypothetical protein